MTTQSPFADTVSSAMPLSVNALAQPLLTKLLDRLPQLGLTARRDARGVLIVDAGIDAPGSVAAGAAIAEICMGGLGEVHVRTAGSHSARDEWPTIVDIASAQPVLACLASQYAGWSLAASKEETGGKKFFALGSGPARSLACKEPLYEELRYRDNASHGCLVLEVDRAPPEVVIDKILRDCKLDARHLTLILTPTASRAGTTQVVARALEVALHKAHVLGFSLSDIVEGTASAPLPPPGHESIDAMGRTNDAILYGGRVHLSVTGSDDAARDLAQRLPSSASRDFGRPFADVFKEYEYDFYRIDPALFAPAEVWVSNLSTGHTWHAGATRFDLLRPLWLAEA
ncbi:methenyltetrahydromethanopterin cyclohydrolase [Paraburkholderia sp. 1N]|uniref:Methenyltetrahydromethanopterin cyclohydrolase n=1 Tax=Paraburkholderia solitsugae TaxID=2675748 RepID=A0ABX2BJR8_9BURK|nr:methenyltetrahydromethanopterin cyclohydrolase [Paraburkholderia solitsugae]NPT40411.1 methenyltetrahydromethanopterin cyclohydrolase [Paraburkholderia solitsugae]